MKSLLVYVVAISVVLGCGAKNNEKSINKKLEPSLIQLIDSLQLGQKELSILIDKSDYKLYLRADSTTIKEFPVVFGTNPIDDKLMEGDRATPEGKFKIRSFYPHKSWSKFIWIDYPTEDSWKKHNTAKSENRIPSNATIGGEIGIHGVPEGSASLIPEKKNWTWGCISLTNKNVNELYEIVYNGMVIEIVK